MVKIKTSYLSVHIENKIVSDWSNSFNELFYFSVDTLLEFF